MGLRNYYPTLQSRMLELNSICIEILSQIKWKLTVEKNPNSIAILNFLSK